jgi:hypothetical protein
MPRNVFFAMLGRIRTITLPDSASPKGDREMSAETRKILEMLAAGKISSEDAERLIDKVSASHPEPPPKTEGGTSGTASAPNKQRFMRIVVDRPGQDQVNIRMPIPFARTGTRLMAVLPSRFSERLADLGVDVASLGLMAESIEDCNIDVDRGNGKRVRIFCE